MISIGRLLEDLQQDLVRRAGGQRFQRRDGLGPESPVPRRIGVDDLAAAERLAGRRASHDEAVASQHRDGRAKAELNPGALARIQPLAIEQGDARRELGRAGEEIDLVVLLQGDRRVGQEAQAGVEALARGHDARAGPAHRRA